MTIMVNGEARELTAIGISNVEWTRDLLGNYGALHMDDDDNYTMSSEDFDWWSGVVEKYNEVVELEQMLSQDAKEEYESEPLSDSDLDFELDRRLGWLREHEV